MASKTQIGWLVVDASQKIHNAGFSYAAWWEDIAVEPSKYPVYVYDLTFRPDGEMQERGTPGACYAELPGVVIADYFASHYFGVPVGDYDTRQNAGKSSSYTVHGYLYNVAMELLGCEILPNPYGHYELFPEYESREIRFTYDGEQHTTYGIFRKEGVSNVC